MFRWIGRSCDGYSTWARYLHVHPSARSKVTWVWQSTSARSPTAIGQCHLRVGDEILPQDPACLVAKIAEEYAAGMSGPKLAKKYGVGSTRTIYLTLEKYRREQAQT